MQEIFTSVTIVAINGKKRGLSILSLFTQLQYLQSRYYILQDNQYH